MLLIASFDKLFFDRFLVIIIFLAGISFNNIIFFFKVNNIFFI